MSSFPQISFVPSSIDYINEIDEMAKKENRSRSKMIDILLQAAIKERNRKRKNAKEDNS